MIKEIKRFLKRTLGFIKFCLCILIYWQITNPIKKDKKGKVVVLANGPSLKEIIPLLTTSKEFTEDVDFIVLNFFAFNEIFFEIKPQFYCLADPIFFKKNNQKDKVKLLFSIFNERVNWSLDIYIPAIYYKSFVHFSRIDNKNINIYPVNNIEYSGYEKFRNYFYKKGLSIPRIQNITILSTYVGIQKGYDIIALYGVDHDVYKSTYIDSQNQLCLIDIHFYDKEKIITPKPIRHPNGKVWKISEYMEAMYLTFKSHDLIASYSKYVNVRIINYTKNSMIDSYERN